MIGLISVGAGGMSSVMTAGALPKRLRPQAMHSTLAVQKNKEPSSSASRIALLIDGANTSKNFVLFVRWFFTFAV